MTRLTAVVSGQVQGVGFRYWVRQEAQSLGLAGWVANLPDGTVEVVAEGPLETCESLLAALRSSGTPGWVRDVAGAWSEGSGDLRSFRVR